MLAIFSPGTLPDDIGTTVGLLLIFGSLWLCRSK